MCMLLPGMGSQYLMAMRDSGGEYLDGARSYRLTLPPDIPESRFWSVMLYDRQTRSMLQTGQPKPDIGSQSGKVQTSPDGSTEIYIGPTAPEGKETNWIQTVPGKTCSRSCGSTTRSRRSSTRADSQARSYRPDVPRLYPGL
jgi:hypothetical protein